MARQIAHRGPDGEGVALFANVGLAHRRLSILDLTDAAAQPLTSGDGRVSLVFNGEIYNFRELRRELEARGERFRSSGDTEVILRLYLDRGVRAIERLDGMFALAIWDDRERRLVLACDRTGKKPLYVYEDAEKILFGSEIKAIFAHPDVDRTMSPAAVPQFLSHGYVPNPGTFYRRIRKLPPASFEVLELGKRSHGPEQYWDFPVEARRAQHDALTVEEAERRVRDAFTSAVERRLVSDVPLGAFLSGGVDSTLVVGVMARLQTAKVKTFSIGFEGYPEWDETGYARLVARRFETDHTEFKVRPESFDLVEKLAWHYDEPFGDSSAIPTFIVSSLTRDHVTVALTGDGGDEVFGGYPRFIAAADPVNRVLYLNARTYLLDDLNVKVDRASMAASLETRAPFLDTALMELSLSLPGHLKIRGTTTKWILKRAFRDLLPREVVHRKKMGFGVPLGAWFRGALRGYLEERLLAPDARLYPMLRRGPVERLFRAHHAGDKDNGLQLWALWMLELWLRREEAA
jgi:asparagine synthase (glutamine-hydrolysing)